MTTGSANHGPAETEIDWEQELQQHRRWLRTVIAARSREPQAVDEILQNVAVAAVGQKSPIRDASRVAPWLYRLAVRQALLYRRQLGRQRRAIRRFATTGQSSGQTSEPDPLDWLLADERNQLIRDALEQLTTRDAEILMLKYTEDWTYQQIADHLGTSCSAVDSRLHRARSRLRTKLLALDIIGGEPPAQEVSAAAGSLK